MWHHQALLLALALAGGAVLQVGGGHVPHGSLGPHFHENFPSHIPPPRLQKLYPDKGHFVGGTLVTISGAGFVRNQHLAVRFSDLTGEVDEVHATYVDQAHIVCSTPPRDHAHDVHVAVANNGVAYSSYPLVTEDEGRFLTYSYVDTAPTGVWALDNSTGPVGGGTLITIEARELHTSTRVADGNFLPGEFTRCRFGDLPSATVPAEWVSYGRIRCRSPPWNMVTDDRADIGGKQVTVYVTNDGYYYTPGTQEPGAVVQVGDEAAPGVAGTGTTFTYYNDERFRDPPMMAPGTSAHLSDLQAEGTFSGDGIAWYEVQVDGIEPETFRWRIHPDYYNATSTADYGEVFVPVSTKAVEMSHGLSVSFLHGDTFGNIVACGAGAEPMDHEGFYGLSGHLGYGCRAVGDTYIFRVGGGRPAVTSVTTTHGEPQYSARAPFEGNAEVVVNGYHFLPSEALACKLYDGATNVTQVVPAQFDSPTRLRCVVLRHEPLPGGQKIGTMRPCFFKTLQVTSDGGNAYSTASAAVQVLFCDVYVSVEGSDVSGHGTPDRPYRTIQKGIEASLSQPRAYWQSKYGVESFRAGPPEEYTGVAVRGPGQFYQEHFGFTHRQPVNKGMGYFMNRDRIIVANGVYMGPGNVGLHPLGKMIELWAMNRGYCTIDCADSGTPAVYANQDRTVGEEGSHTGSLTLFGVATLRCDNLRVFPR